MTIRRSITFDSPANRAIQTFKHNRQGGKDHAVRHRYPEFKGPNSSKDA